MTVYVVQEVKGRNILSAKEFGELKLLLPEGSQVMMTICYLSVILLL